MLKKSNIELQKKYKLLGKKMRNHRINNGYLTMTEVSALTLISVITFKKMEKGNFKPSKRMLDWLIDFYNLDQNKKNELNILITEIEELENKSKIESEKGD